MVAFLACTEDQRVVVLACAIDEGKKGKSALWKKGKGAGKKGMEEGRRGADGRDPRGSEGEGRGQLAGMGAEGRSGCSAKLSGPPSWAARACDTVEGVRQAEQWAMRARQQAGAGEKEKGGGVRLGRRAGQRGKGEED